MSPVVAVTRPLPQASGTASRLAALGFDPLPAPLLEAVPAAPGSAEGIAALALTSRTAALVLAAHPDFHAVPVFAVGAATAAEARRAGFGDVTAAGGDVESLLDRLAGVAGPIVHMAGREHTGALVERLAARGQRAERRVVYAMEARPLPAAERVDHVLLFSPRTARLFAAAEAASRPPWREARCVAMSDNVAAALPGRRVAVAAEPTEAAMLAALTALEVASDG